MHDCVSNNTAIYSRQPITSIKLYKAHGGRVPVTLLYLVHKRTTQILVLERSSVLCAVIVLKSPARNGCMILVPELSDSPVN